MSFLLHGGIFMIPLAACSLVAVAIIAYMAITIRKEKIMPDSLSNKIKMAVLDANRLQQKSFYENLINTCRSKKSILARLTLGLLEGSFYTRKEASETIQTQAREEILALESSTVWLDVIIAIAPLLGLLGTASGLVNIFANLSGAGIGGPDSSPAQIASGISEALNTTIVGLAISVPCIVANGYFTRKVEILASQMETLIHKITTPFTNLYDDNFWQTTGAETEQHPANE